MPTGYVVMYRPRRGVPWVELGRATSQFEALRFIEGRGMFWVQPIREDAALFTNTSDPHPAGDCRPADQRFIGNDYRV